MSNSSSASPDSKRPLGFLIALWWGYCLAAMYILYGGVSIVLGFLDRNYSGMAAPVIFLAVGLLILVFAYAFRDRKSLGWYGLMAIYSIIALYSVFTLKQYGSVVILVLCAAGAVATFASATRECFPKLR